MLKDIKNFITAVILLVKFLATDLNMIALSLVAFFVILGLLVFGM